MTNTAITRNESAHVCRAQIQFIFLTLWSIDGFSSMESTIEVLKLRNNLLAGSNKTNQDAHQLYWFSCA